MTSSACRAIALSNTNSATTKGDKRRRAISGRTDWSDRLQRPVPPLRPSRFDVHLLRKVPDSLIMRLDKGQLSDPTGALRYPPRRVGASS